MSSLHICKTECANNDSKINYIQCSGCSKRYYLKCLLKHHKSSGDFLYAIRIFDPVSNTLNTDIDGSIQNRLNKIFESHACFAFQCPSCKRSYNDKSRQKSEEIETLKIQLSEQKKLIEQMSEKQNENASEYNEKLSALKINLISLKQNAESIIASIDENIYSESVPANNEVILSQIALSSDSNAVPENAQNFDSEIYLSKFRPETTTDHIISFITSKTSLIHSTDFSIESLTGKKWKGRKINFVSFKINTFNKAAYDKIMENDLWESRIVASPFKPPIKKQRVINNPKKAEKMQKPNKKQPNNKQSKNQNQIKESKSENVNRNKNLKQNNQHHHQQHRENHHNQIPQKKNTWNVTPNTNSFQPHYSNFYTNQRNDHIPLFKSPALSRAPYQQPYHQLYQHPYQQPYHQPFLQPFQQQFHHPFSYSR